MKLSKNIFLMAQSLKGLKNKQQYEKEIELYKNIGLTTVEDEIPTYEEYIEFYSKESKKNLKMFMEQTKSLLEFENWLIDNKDKTFTYDEIEQKLLDLKLSINGFNGDFKIEEEQ